MVPLSPEIPLAQARMRIVEAAGRVGRDLERNPVRLLAAIKYLDPEGVAQLAHLGVDCVGENRVEALARKRSALGRLTQKLSWHYIGRLQSRKVPELMGLCDCIETLCTASAAAQLGRQRDAGIALPSILVQVNTGHDPAKDGVPAADLEAFLEALPDGLVVEGLMTMPAASSDGGASSRQAFSDLRDCAAAMAAAFAGRHPMRELSMGTSQDFEVAVEEGATLVRLGRILYDRTEEVPENGLESRAE